MIRINKLRSLCNLIGEIVQEETEGNHELSDKVLDRHRKSQDIVKIREKILRKVRTEVWECNEAIQRSPSKPGTKWKHVGYIQIAVVLGGNHSAWVKMAKAIGLSPVPEEPTIIEAPPESVVV